MKLTSWIVRRHLVALMVVIVVLAGPVGTYAAFQTTLGGGSSPAQGHAEIIAQGVAQMPASEISWRVVTDEAEGLEVATPESRALGFALADEGPIVVNDYWTGAQQKLDPGEAAFVADGASQQRASLDDSPVSYERIALVPSDQAKDAGGDDLVFSGDGFAGPAGGRDLNLLRDVLEEDEATSIGDSGYPVLISVTAGELEVASGERANTLKAGEAAEYTGDLDLTGLDTGKTAFVAAIIGDEVPPAPRFTGSVSLTVFACQAGVVADDLDDPSDPESTGCEPVTTGFKASLVNSNDEETPFDLFASGQPGQYLAIPLAFGAYTLGDKPTLPDGYTDSALYDVNGDLIDDSTVTIDRNTPDLSLSLYLFAPEAATGTVTVRVLNCDPGVTVDTIDNGNCAPADKVSDIVIELFEGGEQGARLLLKDATQNANEFTWTGITLPANDEVRQLGIHEDTLPEGYDNYVVFGSEGPLTYQDADPPYYGFSISETRNAPTLTIYNFQPGETAAGAVTVWLVTCPGADSKLSDCSDGIADGLTSIEIQGPEGVDPLTIDNAGFADDKSIGWGELSLGDYVLGPDSIGLPNGFVIGRVEGPVELGAQGYEFSVSQDSPDVGIVLVAVPEEATPAETPSPDAVDTDDDGLTDAEEAELGTDPTSVDTDGDCSFDKVEVDAGTDPLDATSTSDCG